MGSLPHLFSLWPHPQQRSLMLSGPVFMYVSTRHHTPAALMLFLTLLCATLLPFTTKTTNHAAISPFSLLSLMVLEFASHLTLEQMTMPSFSTCNSSCICCRPSVHFPMYHMRATLWIVSLVPGPIFFDIHHSFVNRPPCCDDDVSTLRSHPGCRIQASDCRNRTLRIPFGIQDPNVGQCLLVEECAVDRKHNFFLHFVGERYTLVCTQYHASLCNARSSRWGGSRVGANGCLVTLASRRDGLLPSGECGS